MEIVNILEALGFNFWQLVVIFALIYLRNEMRKLISRVSSLKIGSNEIILNKSADVVSELSKIKQEIAEDGTAGINRIIDEKIDKKVIGSLINIRKNTTYLWGDIKNRIQENIETRIRSKTFLRVQDDLDILINSGFMTIKQSRCTTSHNYLDNDEVFNLNILVTNPKLDDFIRQAESY